MFARTPLRAGIALVSLFCAFSHPLRADDSSPRPNILFALADDWAWPHAGVYGDRVVKTPVFDRVAAEGVLFSHAFCASPSCSPSRAAMLTGQAIHRLEEGANLWGILPKKFAVYPDLLESSGYYVGHMGKGWGPGSLEGSGRTRNPAGPGFKSFAEFLGKVPTGKPFCFWYGSRDPHRPYVKGSGIKSGMNPADVTVPVFLPDTPEVRSDLLDYYFAVQRYDHDVGELLRLLQEAGQTDNTIVVMTGDNGMPFPRAKANLYDAGARMPLAIRWPAVVKAGRKVDDFISFTDFAPTFLEAARLTPPSSMTGRSFLGVLKGDRAQDRNTVFLERERHANVRRGDLGYPCRAIRTRKFLYIRNLHPERWPAGDPQMHKAVGPFGDVDGSPSKDVILQRREDKEMARFFEAAFAKRPGEELYDLEQDPAQWVNVAQRPEYASQRRELSAALDRWMKETADPRANGDDDRWDRFRYFGVEKAATPRK